MDAAKRQKYLEKIKRLRLMDDNFMTAVFSHSTAAVQKVLRIILQRPDLEVLEVRSQDDLHNLRGRSVRLDVHAVDSEGIHYDIEIQRSDKGAVPKRARFNLSLMDAENSGKGLDFEALPETYIIFITERDVLGHGLPMYHIERYVTETKELFRDDAHIIFVNGAYHGEDEIGKLMADFRTSDPQEMHYEELAEPSKYLKGTEKGVQTMCRAIEELTNESFREGIEQGIEQGNAQAEKRMIERLGESMSAEEIAAVLRFPLERVLELLRGE